MADSDAALGSGDKKNLRSYSSWKMLLRTGLLGMYSVCVCCVFSSDSFWTSSSLDVPAGVTQEEGHTGFLTHLLSAVRALIFLARRIQPFLSLVDREVEFCVLTIQSFSTRWAFLVLVFLFFCERNPIYRDRAHVPTCQRVTRYL